MKRKAAKPPRRQENVGFDPKNLGGLAAWRLGVLFFFSCAACGGARDVIPESHDVRGVERPEARDQGGYEYVAKRAMAFVGLAEARGMDAATSSRVVDHVADALEACAEGLFSQGKLVEGTARIAAHIGPDGAPSGLALRMAPGDAVKANALLCFVAPFKLTMFPPAAADDPARGIALEATWGPRLSGPVGPGGGAGGGG